MSKTILGLDCALHTGWAVVRDGIVCESGVWDFSKTRNEIGQHNGHAFNALFVALENILPEKCRIAYELAHHRGGPATRLGAGWQATVQLFSVQYSMPAPIAIATMTLKKFATGSGRAEKPAMIEYATNLLGRAPVDDNEADAVAVAMWGYSIAGADRKEK